MSTPNGKANAQATSRWKSREEMEELVSTLTDPMGRRRAWDDNKARLIRMKFKAADENSRRAAQAAASQAGGSRHIEAPSVQEQQEQSPEPEKYYFFCGELAQPSALAGAFNDVFATPPTLTPAKIRGYATKRMQLPAGAGIDAVVTGAGTVDGFAALLDHEQQIALTSHLGWFLRPGCCRMELTNEEGQARKKTAWAIKPWEL